MKSLLPMIRHNQGLFSGFAVAAFIIIVLASCQMTASQKTAAIQGAADTAISVATGTPIDWKTVGMIIGSLLGTGTIIDNRRKDILIKVLQKSNAVKDGIIAEIRSGVDDAAGRS